MADVLGNIEHRSERELLDVWRYEDLGCPHCGKTCDVCLTLAEIISMERSQLRGAVEALREIRDADPVDMALDPGWAARIAGAALDAGTTTSGGQ